MKTISKYLLISLPVFLLMACRSKIEQVAQQEKHIPVRITRAEVSDVSFPIRTSGMLASKKEIKLSFKTGGIIQKIHVEEGQEVKKGQQLAVLNLAEIDAQVNRARLAMNKAERDLQRAQNLYGDSVATLEQYQNAQTAYQLAEAQLQVAKFNREYSVINAPATGRILKRLAEENEMIAPGNPLFLFASSESDWVLRTSLTDIDRVQIKQGDRAEVTFDAFPSKRYTAQVDEVAESADPYTGTYEVELRLSHPDKRFVSGLIGTAQIIPSRVEHYKALPVRAVHEAESEFGYVYLAENENYYKKRITIEVITDSLIYFTGEISPEDQVIIEGAEYLSDKSKINIVNE